MRIALVIVCTCLLSGCLGYADNAKPVKNFELNRYLGKWYEVARLDHSFEEGLEKVTATYTMRSDGGIKVLNEGFSTVDNEWSQADGKAFFVEESNIGYLKVSFFGPFYGSYVIFELDKNYQYAFVTGPDNEYLWLLSRTPTVSDEVLALFKKRATDIGVNLDEIIYVEQ